MTQSEALKQLAEIAEGLNTPEYVRIAALKAILQAHDKHTFHEHVAPIIIDDLSE